jgi:hypothetical protein
MSENRVLYTEEAIINAVKRLLTGTVNEILSNAQFTIPLVEFGEYSGGSVVVPAIVFSTCEQTEKERIIRQDVYSLTIIFSFQETPESELFCYAYSGAIGRAFYDDPTLGGVVDRAVITVKKYLSPKKSNCGECWGLVMTLRVNIENEQLRNRNDK